MSDVALSSDSKDAEIIIIKQIKPVKKLSIQKALSIKHSVINLLRSKNRSTSSNTNLNKKEEFEVFKKKTSEKEKFKRKNHKKGNLKKTKSEKGLEKFFCKHYGDSGTEVKSSFEKSLQFLKRDKFENIDGKKDLGEAMDRRVIGNSNRTETVNYCKSNKIKEEFSEDNEIILENVKSSVETARKRKNSLEITDNSAQSKYSKCVDKNICEDSGHENKINTPTCKTEFIQIMNNDITVPDSDDFFLENIDLKNESIIEDLNNIFDGEELRGNSDILNFVMKKIIRDEKEKQLYLARESSKSQKNIEELLIKKECEILERFLELEESACKVYIRMLCRKKHWHRISAIKYSDIGGDLQKEISILIKEEFFDANIEEQDFKIQLDLLSKPEIQQLCKLFNIKIKSESSLKKNDYINHIINNCKNQKSIYEMINKKSSTSRVEQMKSVIQKFLGSCIRLNKEALSAFNKIILLFSFSHYTDKEEKRLSNELQMCVQVQKNFNKFPSYKLSPTVVFQTRYDFEMYENALLLQESFEIAIDSKKHDEFVLIAKEAKKFFLELLNNVEYVKRFQELKPFLRKFSAGSVYARILTKYCEKFKLKSDKKDIINVIQILINQDLFLTSKKGKWYEILSQTLELLKENNEAAEVLIKAQNDPFVNEVQKLTLQLRGQAILKKKSNGIKEKNLRELLDDICTVSVREPQSTEIKGKPFPKSEPGFKSVYVEETIDGKTYTSVEEIAISYYKANGFTNGFHVEGLIVQTIYFLLFYDIIYGMSPPGVFQSPYQTAPLDFFSKSFYTNRKEAIDTLLDNMCSWSTEELEFKLRKAYNENFGVTCLINWQKYLTPQILCDVVKCITLPVVLLICKRFIFNFGVAKSGFPDLTLWNTQTKKCKFVEVKSPNDKLSPAQRVWLDFLRNVGIDCEVCNVKNVSGKRLL